MAGGPRDDQVRPDWMNYEGVERWDKYLRQHAPGYSYTPSYRVNSLINSGLNRAINDVVKLSKQKERRQEVPTSLDNLLVWRFRDEKWRSKHGFKMPNIITYCIIEEINISDVLGPEPSPSTTQSTDEPAEKVDQIPAAPSAEVPKPPNPPPEENIRQSTPWYSIFVRIWKWLFGKHR